MPFFLYAVDLLVCGVSVSIRWRIARWGSEEPMMIGWSGYAASTGMFVLVFNVFGLVTQLLLQQRQYAQSRLHTFLVGGLPGVISGIATGWLMHQSSPIAKYYNIFNNLVLILLLAQAPLWS